MRDENGALSNTERALVINLIGVMSLAGTLLFRDNFCRVFEIQAYIR